MVEGGKRKEGECMGVEVKGEYSFMFERLIYLWFKLRVSLGFWIKVF